MAEGAPGGGRPRGRRIVPAHAAAVRLPAVPGLRRARRVARDEGGDRGGSRAQGTGRRHQARARRHPRDRVPGAGAAVDPRRARTGIARGTAAAGVARAGGRGARRARRGRCARRCLPLVAAPGEPPADAARRTGARVARQRPGPRADRAGAGLRRLGRAAHHAGRPPRARRQRVRCPARAAGPACATRCAGGVLACVAGGGRSDRAR